jgi:molybdopterin converting factor subunit 1
MHEHHREKPMKKVTVRFFAAARELVGRETLEIELPESATVGTLKQYLQERFPPLARLSAHLLVAVDGNYAAEDTFLPEGSMVACFPPVSGG